MRFDELLDIVHDEPVFSSSLLLAGDVDSVDLASQLSRWVASGKLLSLRRGVYALDATYRHREPHAFEIASLLAHPSYVSLESALSFHGLIPEAVFTTTSVTTVRPGTFETELGRFDFRHLSERMFWGYLPVRLGPQSPRTALVARPEKALLDLIYLRPGGDTDAFLTQLRLARFDTLDTELLGEFATRTGKPKLLRAAARIAKMATASAEEWIAL